MRNNYKLLYHLYPEQGWMNDPNGLCFFKGYYATNGIYQIIKNNKIDAPIVEHIYRILYEEKNCEEEFTKLVQKLN